MTRFHRSISFVALAAASLAAAAPAYAQAVGRGGNNGSTTSEAPAPDSDAVVPSKAEAEAFVVTAETKLAEFSLPAAQAAWTNAIVTSPTGRWVTIQIKRKSYAATQGQNRFISLAIQPAQLIFYRSYLSIWQKSLRQHFKQLLLSDDLHAHRLSFIQPSASFVSAAQVVGVL